MDASQSAASAAGTEPTDDEAEVPAARNGDDALPGSLGQIFDDRAWIARAVGERTAECLAQLLDGGGGPDGPFVQRLDEVGRDLGGSSEELPLVAHGASLGGEQLLEAGGVVERPDDRQIQALPVQQVACDALDVLGRHGVELA